MASQAVILSSSITPKLATFNTPTPLLPLPPPRTFSCSSSLPTLCLKASYGGTRALHTSQLNQFKCNASTTDGVAEKCGALEFREKAMASQAVILSSSFTPKLDTFNTPTPLLPLPPPRIFSCSSSLPTLCLKASYGGTRALHTSQLNQFKCNASTTDGVAEKCGASTTVIPGGWHDILDAEHNEEVQALGNFAVEE